MIAPLSLSSLTVPVSPDVGGNAAETSGSGGASFPKLLTRLLGSDAQSHASATAALRDMALGKTDNLHEVMLQMAQADLSFHLILEIRNRLTDAYQEIMKMQV
jgi:flagellar hook-basal body complex protein FliE